MLLILGESKDAIDLHMLFEREAERFYAKVDPGGIITSVVDGYIIEVFLTILIMFRWDIFNPTLIPFSERNKGSKIFLFTNENTNQSFSWD